MLKKVVIVSAAAALLGTFVFGRDMFSYVRTAGTTVRKAVKSEVPVEFEIDRAREMVEQLVPDIRQCMHVIAEQQVDIEEVSARVARREEGLDDQKQQILALRSDLSDGRSEYVYAGRVYAPNEVKRDLAIRFERFKTAEATLEGDRKILRAREDALRANQAKLDGMLVAKKDLELKLEQLEARLKAVQAAETVSTLNIDDSRLTRARKLINDLNKQLSVKEKLLDAEGKFTGLIPVETEPSVPEDLGEQIDEYFEGKQPEKEEGEELDDSVALIEIR